MQRWIWRRDSGPRAPNFFSPCWLLPLQLDRCVETLLGPLLNIRLTHGNAKRWKKDKIPLSHIDDGSHITMKKKDNTKRHSKKDTKDILSVRMTTVHFLSWSLVCVVTYSCRFPHYYVSWAIYLVGWAGFTKERNFVMIYFSVKILSSSPQVCISNLDYSDHGTTIRLGCNEWVQGIPSLSVTFCLVCSSCAWMKFIFGFSGYVN